MHWKVWLIAAVGLAGVGLLAAGERAEVPGEEAIVSSRRGQLTSVTLQAGETIQQPVLAAPGTYGAVTLYTQNPRPAGQQITVIIREDGQIVLAESTSYTTRYQGDRLVYEVAFTPFHITEENRKSITAAITLQQGPSLIFDARQVAITEPPHVTMGVKQMEELSYGAKRGLAAGVAVLVGVTLMQLVPSRRVQWGMAAAILAGAVWLGIGGFWENLNLLGVADWDYYFSLHHAYRDTLLTYHQFPFWNPYTCGGTAGLGDPEFPVFTLTFLAELIFGIPLGLRMAVFLSVFTGGLGLLALAKQLKRSPTAAVLVAIVGVLSTVNLVEITEGHVNVLSAMWIPWIFWAWLRAYRAHGRTGNTKGGRMLPHLALLALFLALTFYAGGIYLLMYTTIAFLVLPWLVGRPRSAVVITVQAGLLAAGLAAMKLIPVLLWLRQFPDEGYASSANTLHYLSEIFFGRHLHGSTIIFEQAHGWHEYAAYIGYIVFVLALIGASRWQRSRVIPALVAAAAGATLLSTLGPQLQPYFDLMWFFPRSNISRIIYFAVIPIALLAGYGLDYLKSRSRAWHIFSILLIGLVAVDLLSLSYQASQQAFVLPDVIPAPAPPPHPIGFTAQRFDPSGQENRTTRAYAAARLGWGTYTYCSVLGPDPAVEPREGDQDIIQVEDHASYELLTWTPNIVSARVTAPEPTGVILSTTYTEGWKVNGQPAANLRAQVGTTVPAGDHVVTFSYRSPGFRTGLTITFVTIAALLVLLVQGRKKQTR